MRIAHIVSTFPPRVGGMGQVCLEEAKRLADAGHDVTVFTTKYKGGGIERCLPSGDLPKGEKFKVVYLNSFLKTSAAAFVPQLFWRLRGFDIVHLHYPFYGALKFVWLAKIFNKQKFVVTYHMDAQILWPMKLMQIILDALWPRLVLSNAEKVIMVDKEHFAASKFAKFAGPDKLVEIYNGVDVEIFKPIVNIIEPDKARTILFVGNLLSFKRFDLIIKALAATVIPAKAGIHGHQSPKDISILAIGGEYNTDKYKKMADKFGVADKIKFIGPCDSREKLAEYYSSAQCLMVASDSGESFSLAAVEALACGCPVIASDISGVRGRVRDGETGYIFKSGSADDLALKINQLLSLSDEDRRVMKEKCRVEALDKYDWRIHCEKLEDAYKSI